MLDINAKTSKLIRFNGQWNFKYFAFEMIFKQCSDILMVEKKRLKPPSNVWNTLYSSIICTYCVYMRHAWINIHLCRHIVHYLLKNTPLGLNTFTLCHAEAIKRLWWTFANIRTLDFSCLCTKVKFNITYWLESKFDHPDRIQMNSDEEF